MNGMDVEEVFSSKPRMKILRLVARLGALNVSDIARRIKMNYSTTNQHIIMTNIVFKMLYKLF